MRSRGVMALVAAIVSVAVGLSTPAQIAWAGCGDGILDAGEECDDGNTVSGDGCDSLCHWESADLDTCVWAVPYGDFNRNVAVNSADVIYLVNYIFKGGPEPWPCDTHGDIDCSGAVAAGDVIRLLNYVFRGQPLPCDICWESPMGPDCPD